MHQAPWLEHPYCGSVIMHGRCFLIVGRSGHTVVVARNWLFVAHFFLTANQMQQNPRALLAFRQNCHKKARARLFGHGRRLLFLSKKRIDQETEETLLTIFLKTRAWLFAWGMMSERSDGLTTAARVWISQERDVWQPALLLHRTRDQAEVIIEADSSWVNAEPVSSPASSGSAKLQKVQSLSIFSRQPTVLCLAKAILVPRNPAHLEGIDDLVKLQFLDEPNILHNLSLRYSQGKIYTNTGPILIATNPWRHLDIYSEGAMDLYKGRDLGELPPHVYGIADSAYRAMLRERRNQVCCRFSHSHVHVYSQTCMVVPDLYPHTSHLLQRRYAPTCMVTTC